MKNRKIGAENDYEIKTIKASAEKISEIKIKKTKEENVCKILK
jgi:hypothetical protein